MQTEREHLREVVKGMSVGKATIENTVVDLPQPMITTTDVNYAEEYTIQSETDVSYQNKLHEIRERWSKEKLSKVENSDKAFDDKLEWIKSQKENSSAEKFMYTPIIRDDVHITKNVMTLLHRLQIKGGMNLINMVDSPYMPADQYIELLKGYKKEIADIGQEPFLQLDARYENLFAKKTNIGKELGLSGITVMYANPMKYLGTYKVLAEMRNSSMIRHLSNVDRYYIDDKKSAVMPLSFFYADTFSTKLGMGSGKKKDAIGNPAKAVRKVRVNVKRYDLETSAHLKMVEHRKEHGEDLKCLCPICNGNMLSDILAECHKYLYTTFRAHEPYAISAFVDMVRIKAKGNKLLEFLNKKKYTHNTLQSVFGIGQVAIRA